LGDTVWHGSYRSYAEKILISITSLSAIASKAFRFFGWGSDDALVILGGAIASKPQKSDYLKL